MRIHRLTRLSLFVALALIVFIIEAQIPPLIPFPGIKLGLANVITLVVLALFGRRDAFLVFLLRVLLGSIFTVSPAGLVYSLSGGLLCFLVMALFLEVFRDGRLWVLSVLSAIAHNIGQILMAAFLMRTWAVAVYLPILIVSAVVTGLFTGVLAQAIVQRGK